MLIGSHKIAAASVTMIIRIATVLMTQQSSQFALFLVSRGGTFCLGIVQGDNPIDGVWYRCP